MGGGVWLQLYDQPFLDFRKFCGSSYFIEKPALGLKHRLFKIP